MSFLEPLADHMGPDHNRSDPEQNCIDPDRNAGNAGNAGNAESSGSSGSSESSESTESTDSRSAGMTKTVVLLEQCFQQVYLLRMQDVPVVNPLLEVKALGFRPWQSYWFGVLVTPWFINLIMLPQLPALAVSLKVGHPYKFTLPCGDFVFLGCHESAMGGFLSCSLLSPVTELDSQQQAEVIAWEALQAIFECATDQDIVDPDTSEIERFNACTEKQGHRDTKQQTKEQHATDGQMLSRRQFLASATGRSAQQSAKQTDSQSKALHVTRKTVSTKRVPK